MKIVYVTLCSDQEARTLSNVLKKKKLKDIELDTEVLGDGKRSRLIIRNLSFKCSVKHLTNVFSKHGQVVHVSIPHKKGEKSGFGFVQFLLHSEAQNAMNALNGTNIDNRPIAVDWALPKDKYVKHMILSQSNDDSKPTEESNNDDQSMNDSDNESSSDDDDEESSDEDDDDDDTSESSESESDDDDNEEIGSFDIHQNATIFIRNLSFDSSQFAIEELFTKWGDVEYANIVRDFETKRSRGTAFVKFKEAESAELCLSESYPKKTHPEREGESITNLDGRNLILSIAVDRKKAKELEAKEKKPKEKIDKRNLYLAYEGNITEQDEIAKDISKSDMAKRKRALVEKKTKLQNPNFFVSKTRLSVRNIPKHYSDNDLRDLFKKHSPIGSSIKQVKIVRENERVDHSSGKGRSRGFGFVEFKEHNDALEALRAINNNPKLFTKQSRPIVEFAVENAKALQKLKNTMSRGKVNPKGSITSKKPPTSNDNHSKDNNNKLTGKKRDRNSLKDSDNNKNSNDNKKNQKPPKKMAKNKESDRIESSSKKPKQSPTSTAPASNKQKPQQSRNSMADLPPKRKNSNRPRKENKDSFDNIVDSYKKKFLSLADDSTKGHKKWYD